MIELSACPVRDVQAQAETLDLFDACYRVEVLGLGDAARFTRQVLPVAGGLLEQPARTLDALHLVERIANEEIAADMSRRRLNRPRQERDNG